MSWFTDLFKRSSKPARPTFVAMARSIGTSMAPTYADGEYVNLELCRFADLRNLDVVVYWHETGRYVHHRLIGRDANGQWLTQGDHNGFEDTGRMTEDEFVGRTSKLSLPKPLVA